MSANEVPEALKQLLLKHHQDHLLQWLSKLPDASSRAQLIEQLESIEFSSLEQAFTRAISASTTAPDGSTLEPLEDACQFDVGTDPKKTEEWNLHGFELIRQGKVGVLLLAGGQGTRLGSKDPKGMFDIGLPSHKSLYQLQAERILRLQQRDGAVIPWYIMTSEGTHQRTIEFFQQHKYFGLSSANVMFFRQGELPCLSLHGKILLASSDKIAMAPDGNGGMFAALFREGVLKDMQRRELQYIHVYGVDNCLVRVGDPVMMGFADINSSDACSKVVKKAHPTEPVGVFAVRNGRYQVVEYSEIDPRVAQETNEKGQLKYNAANIANHVFSVDFLASLDQRKSELTYHVAKKKIPSIDENGKLIEPSQPNGIKLELFVFDVMHIATKMHVLFVPREDEFSPLKNASGAADSTPEHARADLFACHAKMLRAAGAELLSDNTDDEMIVEISPLVSYAGEGLDGLRGCSLTNPVIIPDLQTLNNLKQAITTSPKKKQKKSNQAS